MMKLGREFLSAMGDMMASFKGEGNALLIDDSKWQRGRERGEGFVSFATPFNKAFLSFFADGGYGLWNCWPIVKGSGPLFFVFMYTFFE